MTNIRLSELAALTRVQRSQNLNFWVFSLSLPPHGILEGDFSSLSLNISSCDTEHEHNWFRNAPLVDPWVGIPRPVWFPHPGAAPLCRLEGRAAPCSHAGGWIAPAGRQRGGRKHMGTPGGARVCLEGSAVNEFWLYTKMWNLFSRFPCHQQHPGALEAEGQLPHLFPGVSWLKKKSLFVVFTLWWGAGMGWLGNPWSSECNWRLTELQLWPWFDN